MSYRPGRLCLLQSSNPASLELLEPRRMLTSTITNKELIITGRSTADVISMSVSGSNLRLNDNGSVKNVAFSTFNRIRVNAGSGNDSVTLPSNLPKTVSAIVLDAGNGHDTVVGSNKGDNMIGGSGNDSMTGNGGDDTLLGQAGNDNLSGGAGDRDRIHPGLGNDICSGGAGTFDTFTYQDRTDDVTARIDGGGSSGNLASGEIDTPASDFENVVGGKGNDLVIGNALSNVVGGDEGNDTLDGGLGSDQIWGDPGIDTVSYASRTAPVFVTFDGDGTGNDGAANEGDLLFTLENITGGSSHDVLSGDAKINFIDGGAGNDQLNGGEGADTIHGGVGRDLINAGGGANRVRGGAHNDTITGGSSIDTFYGDHGNDRIEGVKGNDRMFGGDGDDTLIGGAGADRMDGGAGTDSRDNDSTDSVSTIEQLV
jgi:Ca2+-binding RTX toxin-like protein